MGKQYLVVVLVAAVVGVCANVALAGEVKGPPGTPCGGTTGVVCTPSFNDTGAPAHANSICAFSGLNDMNPAFGQTASQVQTAADSFKFYDLPHGTPGTACRGGSNPDNPPTS
jgi:hypothetical protein